MKNADKNNRICAENAFEIAHKFVDLQKCLNREAGTAWSLIRNLFHKVNYDYYYQGAKEILEECRLLKNRIYTIYSTDKNQSIIDFRDALMDYLNALYTAANIFARKAEFLANKSKSASFPETSYHDFQKIVKEEIPSLNKCQETGDRLTRIYRKLFSEELEFEKLLEFVTRKTAIGKKYDSAKTVDDFIYFVAEQILISVISIMFSLKIPKRGTLILKILKKFKPERYYAFWNRNNNLFSKCLIFVVNEFKKDIENAYSVKLDTDFIARIITQTSVLYYSTIRMNEEEKEMLKSVITETIISYENNPLKEHADFLKKIIAVHGKNLTKRELAKFLQSTIINNPLGIIEPWSFIENYKRLMP